MPDVLREAVELTTVPGERADRAELAARALGLWGHHDSVIAVCREVLAGADALERAQIDSLEAAASWLSASAGAAHWEALDGASKMLVSEAHVRAIRVKPPRW